MGLQEQKGITATATGAFFISKLLGSPLIIKMIEISKSVPKFQKQCKQH